MALGALDLNAKERLGRILGELQGIRLELVKAGGWAIERAAITRDKLTHQLIDRDVFKNLVTDPVVIDDRGLVRDISCRSESGAAPPIS